MPDMSVYETLDLMLRFEALIIAFLTLIVTVIFAVVKRK